MDARQAAIRRGPASPAACEQAEPEAGARYAWAPVWAREELGGPSAPWVRSYVERLAMTDVGLEDQNFSSGRSLSAGNSASARTGRAAVLWPHATHDLAGYPYLCPLHFAIWE
jgi:hypothetical protein